MFLPLADFTQNRPICGLIYYKKWLSSRQPVIALQKPSYEHDVQQFASLEKEVLLIRRVLLTTHGEV